MVSIIYQLIIWDFGVMELEMRLFFVALDIIGIEHS